MHQREIRLALLRNGHLPIPVQGKRPLLQNWQNLDPDEEMIARWAIMGITQECFAGAPLR